MLNMVNFNLYINGFQAARTFIKVSTLYIYHIEVLWRSTPVTFVNAWMESWPVKRRFVNVSAVIQQELNTIVKLKSILC